MTVPITLSYEQFLKTPFGPRGRAGYTRYLQYVRARRDPTSVPHYTHRTPIYQEPGPQQPALAPRPLAPIQRGPLQPAPKKPDPYAGVPAGLLPSKWDPVAIQQMLMQSYAPMMDYYNRIYQQGLYAAGQATAGLTGALKGEYAPMAARAAAEWGAQSSSAKGANKSMQKGVKGQTADAVNAASRYAELSGSGDQIVTDAANRGAQIGKVLAALHQAQYEALQATAGAQQDIFGALPGIADLRALANLKDYTLQATKSRDDQLFALQAQMAQQIPALYTSWQDREAQKALGVLAYTGANQRAQTSAATSLARTAITTDAQWRRTQAQITAARNRAMAAIKNRNTLAYNSALIQLSKLYKQPVTGISPNGVPLDISGKPITKVPTAPAKKGSATAVASLRGREFSNAVTVATILRTGLKPGAKPSAQQASLLGSFGIAGTGPKAYQPRRFKEAYRILVTYFRGLKYTPVTARVQALRALQVAGYPVRADLIPPGLG